MRHLPLILCLALAAPVPAVAQDATENTEEEEGTTLMQRGAQMFMRGMIAEMEPALRRLQERAEEIEPALRSFVDEMGPALLDLLDRVQDFRGYYPPEMLPNGDIIMRRRPPDELKELGIDPDTGETEL
ncbi:hypothetical protein [Pseudooceanicola sp. LIPI14-2-Ac024]|uniref:hypothetical protein n=1 Tax=Pseudooceanicola sp. LIPI14-2-Ac024 TaxID=3344875 RepID=UPI0035D0A2F0